MYSSAVVVYYETGFVMRSFFLRKKKRKTTFGGTIASTCRVVVGAHCGPPGFDRMVRRVLTASLCGVAALLAPGRAVVTAVPRRRPVLKPGGKEEARAPPRRLTFGGDCFDTDNGATDLYGDGCSIYDTNPQYCGGYYDDNDFSSDDMCCACDGGSEIASPTTAPTHSESPTGSHAPTGTPTQVGAFGPFRFACNGLAEGGHLNVEVINDITFGQQIDLDGDRSLRVFCDAAASRRALSGGGARRLFEVADGAVLEFVHLELRDGYAQDDGYGRQGGVFYVWAATLILVDCLVRGGSSYDRVRGARGVCMRDGGVRSRAAREGERASRAEA